MEKRYKQTPSSLRSEDQGEKSWAIKGLLLQIVSPLRMPFMSSKIRLDDNMVEENEEKGEIYRASTTAPVNIAVIK